MTRRYSFAPGEYYHLYSRGVEKRQIFLDEKDKERFIRLLFFGNSYKPVNIRDVHKGLTFGDSVEERGERLVDIGTYCLMPNHFHLLIRERSDYGISTFMQKIMTAYTMYFNVKNQRKGRLFESSYLSTHADYDEYLKYLFAYIHLNPLKLIDATWREKKLYNEEWAKRVLDGYAHSSYADYSGINRDQGFILNREEFPEYFPDPSDFSNYLSEWFAYSTYSTKV